MARPRIPPPRRTPATKTVARKGAATSSKASAPVSSVLGEAAKLLKRSGADAAIAFLEARSNAADEGADGLATRLSVLGAATQLRDPPCALQLAERALAIAPGLPAALLVAASVHDRLGRRTEAQAAVLEVVRSPHATHEQVIRAANLLVRFGHQQEALERATAAYRALNQPVAHAANLLYIAQVTADWALVDELTTHIREHYRRGEFDEVGESPRTHLLWCDDEALNIRVVSQWSVRSLILPKPAPRAPVPLPLQGRRLRVGYLSSDYRDHPTARLINGMLRHHDRTRFEVFLYDSGWDDKSAMRREVESHVDHVHDVAKLSDDAAAQLIRSHGIDVLVELNGPTRANRMGILARRPAPVQIDYLGWPGSVGGRVVDYVVGDPVTVPEGAQVLYPEKVVRVAATYQVNDHAAQPRAKPPSREQAGLPAAPVVVFGMFNAINKVHNAVWDTWMSILKAVPQSVLWLLDPGVGARKRVISAAVSAGVPASRILLAPRAAQAQHLARLSLCDLMLDPWPYGGHTSTADALSAGVPVIAMQGGNFAGRVSGGLLLAAGLGELVHQDAKTYIRTATTLATQPQRLAALRERIHRTVMQSPLFDARRRTLQFEAAYVAALERARDGLPPDHIDVTDVGAAVARPQAAPAARAGGAALPARLTADVVRLPLLLACGPWGSGTGTLVRALAKAGLQVPGPLVQADPADAPSPAPVMQTRAFDQTLRALMGPNSGRLQRTVGGRQSRATLAAFRDQLVAAVRRRGSLPQAPLLLHHPLAAWFLDDLGALFDLRLVTVLRPLPEIETVRAQAQWPAEFGQAAASDIYTLVMQHLIASRTPFQLLRHAQLAAGSQALLADLAPLCRPGLSAFPVAPVPVSNPGAAAASRPQSMP